MAKYSFEFKLTVVKSYLDGAGGYKFLAKKYGIPGKSGSQLKIWVANYRQFGEDGLIRSKKDNHYSVQFKIDTIELYLTTEISYQQLALKLKINNPSLIANWVRAFHAEGIEGLSKPKGRPAKMKNKNTNQLSKNSPIKSTDKNSERIKELENQVLSLEIQNAFLKELRSLQTEENQNQTNKLQKLSTDSEENSN
jgi:transposase